MTDAEMLTAVKSALNIAGTYQDATLSVYIDEVKAVAEGAGVAADNLTAGLVAVGVSDLWQYGSGSGRLSPYFHERLTQLALTT